MPPDVPEQQLGAAQRLLAFCAAQSNCASDPAWVEMRAELADLILQFQSVQAQRQFYHDLFVTAALGVVITDLQGVIQEANAATAQWLGESPTTLAGKNLLAFIAADEAERQSFRAHLQRLQAGEHQAWGSRLCPTNASPFYAALNATLVADPRSDNSTFVIRWAVRDITRPKHTEEQLVQSEQKLRGIFENATDGICMADEQGRIVEWNRSMAQITGIPLAGALGKFYWEIAKRLSPPGEPFAPALVRMQAMLAERATWTGGTFNVTFHRSDGTRRRVHQAVFPVRTDMGIMLGNVVHDITEYQQIELMLRRTNDELEARVRERAQALTEAIQILQEEILRRQETEASLRHRLDGERVISRVSSRLANLTTNDMDAEIRQALQLIGEFSGADRGYAAFLTEGHTRFARVLEWCAAGIASQAEGVMQIPAPLVAHLAARLTQDQQIHIPRVAVWTPRNPAEKKLALQRELQSFILVPMNYRGALIGALAFETVRAEKHWVAEDIAVLQVVAETLANALERYRAENALRESEHHQAAILNSVPIALYTVRIVSSGIYLTWLSRNIEQLTGFPADWFTANPEILFTRLHPADRIRAARMVRALRRQMPSTIESRWLCADGAYRWFLARITLTQPIGADEYVGTLLDITDRKRAEEAEHEQRVLAEALRDTAESLNNTLDAEQVLRCLLANVERVVPCDGANVMLIADGKVRLIAWRGYEKFGALNLGPVGLDFENRADLRWLLESGQVAFIPDLHADPDWMHLRDSSWVRAYIGVPIRAQGEVIAFLNVDSAQPYFFDRTHVERLKALTDQASVALTNAQLFTETRHAADRLRGLSQRLVQAQEIERGRIARELHDETGQTLTALMVDLHYIERHADDPAALVAHATNAKKLVNRALEGLHQLVADLRPTSLEHLGLAEALRQHIETVSRQHGLPVEFEDGGLGGKRLNSQAEIALYRIAQEALTNVVRHAQATRAEVLLALRAQRLSVAVWDDGVGIDPNVIALGDRMGLVGMRERAEMLGGTLVIESQRGAGTRVRVEVPYGNSNFDRG